MKIQYKLDSQRNLILAAAAALALAGASACSGDDQTEVAADPPTATLAASEETQRELGVESWDVFVDADASRIVGRRATPGEEVSLIARQNAAEPGESVDIELSAPAVGTARLRRDGAVTDASSPYLEQLAAALHADLAEPSAPAFEVSDENAIGTAELALSDAESYHDDIPLGWSMFGYRADITINNGWCQGTRTGYHAYSDNGASCWVIDWVSPPDASNCGIRLHYGIAGGRTDTCHWYVYRQQ